MHQVEEWLKTCKLSDLTKDDFFEIKRKGFSDAQLARFLGTCPAISWQDRPAGYVTDCTSTANLSAVLVAPCSSSLSVMQGISRGRCVCCVKGHALFWVMSMHSGLLSLHIVSSSATKWKQVSREETSCACKSFSCRCESSGCEGTAERAGRRPFLQARGNLRGRVCG